MLIRGGAIRKQEQQSAMHDESLQQQSELLGWTAL
jgi:hypothetical protein